MKTSKHRRSVPAALAAVLVLAFSVTTATALEYVAIDQSISNSQGSIGLNHNAEQTFTAVSNNITAISVFLPSGTSTVTLQLRDAVCGTLLNHGTASGSGWVKCDLVGAEAVIPGNTYSFKLVGIFQFSMANNLDPYAGGAFYNGCLPWVGGFSDLKFQVWTADQPVATESGTWGTIKALYR